jgi:putative transcriptional regulator
MLGDRLRNRIKELRAERRWSQAELGVRLDMSRQSINMIETGKINPSLRHAFRLARIFGLRIDAIFDCDT